MQSNKAAVAAAALDGRASDRRAILDSLPVGVIVANLEGTIVYRNGFARRTFAHGVTLDEAFAGVRFPEPFRGWSQELKSVASDPMGRRWTFYLYVDSDDPQYSSGFSIQLTRHASCDQAVVISFAPIEAAGTALLNPAAPEDQYETAQRLASLGRMAARVAHELNNPLDGILRYINLALRLAGDEPDSRLKSYLTESRTGLLRMIEIIGDLLEYSRATAGTFDDVEINEVVEQAIRGESDRAEANAVIVTVDFQSAHMPAVRGGRLYQVCRNLIRNAIDAMPTGGRLSITTGLVNDEVVIRVADTGGGLPDSPEKTFEPFFTTKPPGQGTGLGLAICRDLVRDMGGFIWADRAEPRGAVFTVRIPFSYCVTAGGQSVRGTSTVEGP